MVFAAVAGAFVGIFSDGFTNWDKFKPVTQKPQEEATGGVFDGNGNSMDENTVYDLPNAISFSMAALSQNTNGLSVTVNATVQPSTATNKAVDWFVSWADSANSTDVTQYVNVIPSSDGSTTATVTCYQAFTGDVIITVTTRESGYTADCIVSFVGIPSSLSVSCAQLAPVGDTYGMGVGVSYAFNIKLDNVFEQVGDIYKEYDVYLTATGSLTVGTYESDPRGSKVWYDERSAELSEFADNIVDYSVSGNVLTLKLKKSIEGYYTSSKRTGTVSTYYDKVKTVNSPCSFTISIKSKKLGASSPTATFKIVVDNNVVTGVSLNKNSLEF